MSYPLSLAALTDNLVPFCARRVTSSLIWCVPGVDDEEALHHACSYLIDPVSSAPTKIFLAERYGGSGIQRNGGGARCGFDGRYQVKGIGANPLVGLGTDKRHSNGALGAVHAIYEALWGEVLAQVLPYGAVRTQAVLLTDKRIDNAFELSQGSSQRALLVREPAVRPAHFERAPYFRPQPEYSSLLMHDAHRVRSVIRMLPASLPTPSAGFSEEAYFDPRLYCIEGLCELARRQAWQMAYCRTRFLRLTTSPSNMAMDGRLLDFNGLSCLFPGDYPDDFGYRLRLTELMKEPVVLQQGLSDLCLYLGKYLFDPAFTLLSRQRVKEAFQKAFAEAYVRGYLTLLGIPVDILQLEVIPDTLIQLVHGFMKLFDSLSGTMGCSYSDMPNESLLERLAVALIHRSQGQNRPDNQDLEQHAYFPEVLRYFNDGIYWLARACDSQGIDASVILKEMEQHVRQRLQPRAWLGKLRMFKEITGLLDAYGEDTQSLQHAIGDMVTKMQVFALKVLYPQQPTL
ncbi:MchC protein [Rouxiella sp. Mn2063]|uniref:MchC protein n=1 Tax=Rouxiella sp. Mn2063 TaxID=3395262 RepID=UPI003BD8BCF8